MGLSSAPLHPDADAFLSTALEETRHAVAAAKPRRAAPDRLYHYTRADTPANILRTRYLWATHYASLDDKEEVTYFPTLVRGMYAGFCDEQALGAEVQDEKFDTAESAAGTALSVALSPTLNPFPPSQEPYVFSLTEEGEDIQQWIAYGDRARGACLELPIGTIDRILLLRKGYGGRPLVLAAVEYDVEIHRKLARAIVETALNMFKVNYPVRADLSVRVDFVRAIVALLKEFIWTHAATCKHRGFRHQHEWRLIVPGKPIQRMDSVTPSARPQGVEFAEAVGAHRAKVCIVDDFLTAVHAGPEADFLSLRTSLAGSGVPVEPATIPYRGRPDVCVECGKSVISRR